MSEQNSRNHARLPTFNPKVSKVHICTTSMESEHACYGHYGTKILNKLALVKLTDFVVEGIDPGRTRSGGSNRDFLRLKGDSNMLPVVGLYSYKYEF